MINERPGVYTEVEMMSFLSGGSSGRVIGLAAEADKGEKGKCSRITSYGQAVELFGMDSQITKLIKLMFENGAGIIEAIPASIKAAASTEDYEAAFKTLMKKEEVTVMACGSRDSKVHAAMKALMETANENQKYRIGILETGGTVSQAETAAKALNYERLVMLYPGEEGDFIGAAAAAFAGILGAGGDPALPMNGVALENVDIKEGFIADSEINVLVRGGVTPIENTGGKARVVRAVTTKSNTENSPDATWRELTTVLVVDDVIPSVRTALRRKFPRVKNTAQTRGAIRTQVTIELEKKKTREIIDSFSNVRAEPDVEDPTLCVVSFDFTVAHGLNRILISAHINV